MGDIKIWQTKNKRNKKVFQLENNKMCFGAQKYAGQQWPHLDLIVTRVREHSPVGEGSPYYWSPV